MTFFAVSIAAPAAWANYNGPAAASYEDSHWGGSGHGYNRSYISFPDDCTNFVSQGLSAAGFPHVGSPGYQSQVTNDNFWWYYPGNDTAPDGPFVDLTRSWSVANDQYNFMLWHYPGGYYEGTAPGTSVSEFTPNSIVSGDLLFYDWNNDGSMDHVSMQTGLSFTADAKPGYPNFGNYVDSHTNDRYHTFWSLLQWNSRANSTKIYFIHVSPSN